MIRLSIDIGNTSVSMAVFRLDNIAVKYHFDVNKSNEAIKVEIAKICRNLKKRKLVVESIVACSVVPKKTTIVCNTFKSLLDVKPKIVGRNLQVPMKNKYRDPDQVGADRLVGAYAVKELYGSPAIIIDFGTAITFDVVTARGDYDGGLIVPGIRLTTESLFKKTALLPNVLDIQPPRNLIGKDTQESILSGIFNGYGALCQGLIESISKSLKKKPYIVVTGGYTKMMKKYIHEDIDVIDRDLVLKGLNLLAQE